MFPITSKGGGHECLMGSHGPDETFHHDNNVNMDICLNYNTQYWSMKKLSWVTFKDQPKLPTNFSMISGCGLSLTRQKVLLIGGHRNANNRNSCKHDYVDKYLPNDQVLMYEFVRQSWTWLTSIPLGNLWPSELNCSVMFDKTLKT